MDGAHSVLQLFMLFRQITLRAVGYHPKALVLLANDWLFLVKLLLLRYFRDCVVLL